MEYILISTLLFFLFILLYRQQKLKKKLYLKTELKEVSFLPAYETRVRKVNNPVQLLMVEFRGQLPNEEEASLSFNTSLFTLNANGSKDSVLSLIDTFQSLDSRVFSEKFSLGVVELHSGSYDWQNVCSVPLHYIQLANSGEQTLMIHTSIIDNSSNAKSEIDREIVSSTHHQILNFEEKGYLEEGLEEVKTRVLILRLAVSVAFSDNHYHEKERDIINGWIKKIVSPYKSGQKIEALEILSNALKAAEEEAENKTLNLDIALKELRDRKSLLRFFEAIELAIDVMAADGKEDRLETKIIEKIADNLLIDENLLSSIKNQKVSKLEKPLVKR